MYDTGEYAYSRLGGTIVRLAESGRPITVSGCESEGDDIAISYTFLNTGRQGKAILLSEVDLTPVPLGWADHASRDSAYLARIPKRNDYRQGLRGSNYTSLFGSNTRHITASNLNRCILGNYTSFEDALDESANLGKMTAFSRAFAVKPHAGGHEFSLFFKWYGAVGDVLNGLPQLNNRFEHLQESLEGDM